MARAPVVVGVAEHSGWAILVGVSVKRGSPEIVDRRRVELIDRGLPARPYEHDTIGMHASEAERLIEEVRDSATRCAERALSRLRSSLGPTQQIVAIAMRTPPLPSIPGTVAQVHASRNIMLRADGMLYLEAIRAGAASLGIKVETFARGEERASAAEAMATSEEQVDRFLIGQRERLGPPWQQDHQTAAARALAALGRFTALRLS